MAISGSSAQSYIPPTLGSNGGEENADLKAERKAIIRQSLKDGNEVLKSNENKKHIEGYR